MTAKQIVENIKQGTLFSGGFDEWESEEMIKDYAKKCCEEQRELCVTNYNTMELPKHMAGVTKRRIREVIKTTCLPELP